MKQTFWLLTYFRIEITYNNYIMSGFYVNDYSKYFKTDHWWNLRYKHIVCNDQAKCFVCDKRDSLLLHHVNYQALWREKLLKDVYIVCFDCHELVHFWFFRLIKVPLTINSLLFSMRLRKSMYCIQTSQFSRGLAWFLLAIILGVLFFTIYLIIGVIKGVYRLLTPK